MNIAKSVEPISELKKICVRHNHESNIKTYPLSGRASIYLTWLLLHTSITPNQVTLLSLIFGLLSAVSYFSYGALPFIIGFILFQFHVILDVVDGEIARYRKISSVGGAYLDYVSHYIVYPLIMFGIGYA